MYLRQRDTARPPRASSPVGLFTAAALASSGGALADNPPLTGSVLFSGAVSNAIGFDSFLSQRLERSGRRLSGRPSRAAWVRSAPARPEAYRTMAGM
ncbi:hypothetical protein OWM54_11570 [Myxococcus sp. MISCRS1]|uniref:hypothetical protein n=1 Tax=Myxococcus sp. MISCRS1 TaxID=2996786 RepID=UPI00226EAA22|nr:hypothetical protein [Myxococcus sp. MISCRS1]MCY0997779.1 hypothetical protein [Myxococcus sp. MISCRS1]